MINNAGWAPPRRALTKVSETEQDRMIAVNLRAPIALTRLAAAPMLKKGAGAIVNVASTAGIKSPVDGGNLRCYQSRADRVYQVLFQ